MSIRTNKPTHGIHGRRSIVGALLTAVSLIIFYSCSVTQVPEFHDEEERPSPPGEDIVPEVILQVEFEHKMRLYNESTADKVDNLTLELLQTTAENIPSFMCRHIIRIYPYDIYINMDDEPIEEYVLTDETIDDIDFHFNLTLEPGQYQAVIWTDHIPNGEVKDHHYQTKNFKSVNLTDTPEHPGSDFSRKAFFGTASITVPETGAPERIYVNVPMFKPSAKFCILSTGFTEFINSLVQMELKSQASSLSNSSSAEKSSPDEENSKESTVITATQNNTIENYSTSYLSSYITQNYTPEEIKELYRGYYAVITYTGFMTSSFNLFNSLPVSSQQGVSFKTQLEQVGDTDTFMLGWDYFFTSPTGTKTPVCVSIYNPEGELLSQSASFEIPLERGKLTVVKGGFLQEFINSGINMNPDFTGEFNIFI